VPLAGLTRLKTSYVGPDVLIVKLMLVIWLIMHLCDCQNITSRFCIRLAVQTISRATLRTCCNWLVMKSVRTSASNVATQNFGRKIFDAYFDELYFLSREGLDSRHVAKMKEG
jgi:hypothetical protein